MKDSASMISQATEGATKGFLNWSKEQIEQYVQKLKDGELSFIEDRETIDIVKKERGKPEWKIIREAIDNIDLRILLNLGFTLKKIETDKSKLENLRDKISKKYGKKGLHIAQLVQCGILIRYIGILVGVSNDYKEIGERIEEVLNDIEKYVLFIQKSHKPDKHAKIIVNRMRTILPKVIILFSCGTARKTAEKTVGKIRKEKVEGYKLEIQTDEDSERAYYFFLRIPLNQNLLASD